MRSLFSSKTRRLFFAAALGSLLSLLPLPSFAEESITVATWNVALRDQDADDLDIAGFLAEVDFDILIVNEILSQSDLDDLKAEMGREEFHTAISTFAPGSSNPGDLEVGIISRFPLDNIVEFDRSPDNAGENTERRLERVDQRGIADVGVGRGFLVAEVPDLDLFVIASHFKSSRGRSGSSDFSNAEKRELVAAAIATHTLELLADNPDHTVLFGGDVNVGVTDAAKNGTDLTDDSADGYDDTHALLGGGLIGGLAMESLAQNVGETFVSDDFPGTGAIDVLYVAGALANDFNPAMATAEAYGSDHLAVFASTGAIPLPTEDGPEDEPDNELEDEPNDEPPITVAPGQAVIISNALPNPDGPDIGRETITLTYSGEDSLDISEWSLQDEAGNQFTFPVGTALELGDTEIVLNPPTMPLNNDGDTIILLDADGTQQGESFTYSAQDVTSGQPVR